MTASELRHNAATEVQNPWPKQGAHAWRRRAAAKAALVSKIAQKKQRKVNTGALRPQLPHPLRLPKRSSTPRVLKRLATKPPSNCRPLGPLPLRQPSGWIQPCLRRPLQRGPSPNVSRSWHKSSRESFCITWFPRGDVFEAPIVCLP